MFSLFAFAVGEFDSTAERKAGAIDEESPILEFALCGRSITDSLSCSESESRSESLRFESHTCFALAVVNNLCVTILFEVFTIVYFSN